MAVVSCEEIPWGYANSIDENFYRTITRQYLIICDAENDGAAASSAVGLPSLWSVDPDFADSTCRGGSIAMYGNESKKWIQTVNWSSKPIGTNQTGSSSAGGSPSSPSGNPTDPSTPPDERPWTLTKSSREYEKPITKDALEADIVNSAGTRLEGVSVPASNPVFTWSGWLPVTGISLSEMIAKSAQIENSINNATFMGFDTHTVRCTSYGFASSWEQGSWYWKIDISLEYKADKWELQVLDEGLTLKAPTGEPPRPICDSMGNPITQPVPLNGGGELLVPPDPLVYLTYQGYPEEDWSAILPS